MFTQMSNQSMDNISAARFGSAFEQHVLPFCVVQFSNSFVMWRWLWRRFLSILLLFDRSCEHATLVLCASLFCTNGLIFFLVSVILFLRSHMRGRILQCR